MINPIKIVHTESSCGWGGQEIRILEESQGLIKRGYQVTLVCPQESNIFNEAPKYGVPTYPIPIAHKTLYGLLILRRWIKTSSIDIVNTHSSTDSWLTAIACRTIRNAPPIIRTRHLSTTVHHNFPTWWLYRHANRHLVVTGTAIKEQLTIDNWIPEGKITSIPTGIDLNRFKPRDTLLCRNNLGLDTDVIIIGILATLRDWKGHKILFDSLSDIHNEYSNLRILVVGDGPYRNKLNDYLASIRIRNLVLFVGHQHNPEIWLSAMDIFVLPSWGDEVVSQALMQAMATGLPAITTTIGGLAEAVTDEVTGLLIPPRNSKKLAHAIVRLLKDEHLRKKLGSAAKTHAQMHFGRNIMLDRMELIFKELLGVN